MRILSLTFFLLYFLMVQGFASGESEECFSTQFIDKNYLKIKRLISSLAIGTLKRSTTPMILNSIFQSMFIIRESFII